MRGRLRLLFAVLRFAPEMGRADLRRLFACLPFAIIPFMFIYKEVSFGDVIRRKAAQKAALLFFYSRPPQAGTFSYKPPAAGRLLSALRAPYQSAARAPLFLPCLFLFLPKGTVACTTPIRTMSNRDTGGNLLLSLAWRRRGEIRPAAFFSSK